MFGKLSGELEGQRFASKFVKYNKFNKPHSSVSKSFVQSNNTEPHIISMKDDNRPHAEVQINSIKIVGLLDSGANCSILGNGGYELIKQLNLKTYDQFALIKTADGTSHTVSQGVHLPIKYDGKYVTISALLVPSISKQLILGMDFWQSCNIKPVVCDSVHVDKIIPVSKQHLLSDSQGKQLESTIALFPSSKEGVIGCTKLIKHIIDTTDSKPIKQRHYTISPFLQPEVNKEIERMLGLGVIEPANSPWSSPVVVVRKPNGNVRLCLDARKLNEVTKKEAYPLPNINRILGRLTGTRFLSSIDLSDAFWQVDLDESSRDKTAFAVPGKGFFRFKRMPFGLCNSASTLCQLMDYVLGCDLEPRVFTYLDDIIVCTETFEEHLEVLEEVASRLRVAGLTINIKKSSFCQKELRYLGFIVSEEGIRPDNEKIEPIQNYTVPKSIKDLRRLLGMAGWYRRFIENFAEITAPLTELLKTSKNKSFSWTAESENAMTLLKESLTKAPVLANPDYEQKFVIQADASDIGIGAVLVQGEGEEERVVAYFSRKLSAAQRKYHTTEKECLAVLSAIEKFRPYVEGSHFTVITDHASLCWLQNLKDPSGRLGRWALKLQQYNFSLIHRKGKLHVVPDALSRSVEIIDFRKLSVEGDEWYSDLKSRIMNDPGMYPLFKIENQLVYKYCERKGDLGIFESEWRIVVPKNCISDVMVECHDSPLSAHGGFLKTVERAKQSYYWPKMCMDIRKYVRSCETCRAGKHTTHTLRAPMGDFRPVLRPWQIIAVDFVGPFPRSKAGHTYILVVVDVFSKFILIHPLRAATATNTVKFLDERVFDVFGTPETIVSDNGKQFKSTEFSNFLLKRHVKLQNTAYYHPQANAAEAANKTVGNAIRMSLGKDHQNWDNGLSKIACAMNSSFHTSTKMTPYLINFGQNIMVQGDAYRYGLCDQTPTDRTSDKFRVLREQVGLNLKKAYSNSKKYYDLRSSQNAVFYPGEYVWRRNFVQSSTANKFMAKLAPKFIKSYVNRRIGNNNYELIDNYTKKIGVYNAKDMQKACERVIEDEALNL